MDKDKTEIKSSEFDLTAGDGIFRIVSSGNLETPKKAVDLVNHPPHYTKHPSGVECITIVEHMNFCCGNAIKYIWRADEKGNDLQDLEKARWYIDKEISRRKKLNRK